MFGSGLCQLPAALQEEMLLHYHDSLVAEAKEHGSNQTLRHSAFVFVEPFLIRISSDCSSLLPVEIIIFLRVSQPSEDLLLLASW